MEITEAAKRMVKFYVGSDAPLIRAFGQELYVFQGDREEAEEIAQAILDLQAKADRAEALEAEWRAQEERAENAETELVDLRDRYSQLEAVAKDFLRRNKYGPLFYRDLYNRFKEVIGD